MERILGIGAHYDDFELGCGGTCARLLDEGKKVYKITLTDTEVYSDDMRLDIKAERVRANSMEACRKLGGVEEIEFETAPFGNLRYSQDIMQKLEHIIWEYNIDTLMFHYMEDYQTDHIAANQICKTAGRHCKNLLMYQSNPYIIPTPYTPNFFVDITKYVDRKKAALDCYDSDHNRQGNLFQVNIERNKVWGYGNHVEYAEGFFLIKSCI